MTPQRKFSEYSAEDSSAYDKQQDNNNAKIYGYSFKEKKGITRKA